MFTRKEHSMFSDPYFRIIREEEQFIELQSINTGHCWNVFKNQFEAEYRVTLYHKHKATDKYYHQHRKCRNVIDAIQQIKSHDEYVLLQDEEKKKQESQLQEQPTRHLKVYSQSGYNYKQTPTIILKGEWLETWGFEPGAKLNVVCEGSGKLTITVN